MGAEKTKAIVLQILAYRESSCILHLFTEKHGLVHGIAKGIKRRKSRQDILERGFHVEMIIYIREHKELYTLGATQIVDFFPSLRGSLVKTALRDAAFETVISAVTQTDYHPELYDLLCRFLHHLEHSSEQECHPFALWLFYHRFSQHMGFGLDFKRCISCTAEFEQKAWLSINKGGLECSGCAANKHGDLLIPAPVLSFLLRGSPDPLALRRMIKPEAAKKITRLLADYCRYHFDIRREYKALAFLDEMLEWQDDGGR